jgi:hypothetical protein
MNKKLALGKSLVIGFSVMAVSMLAFPARATILVTNGSFEDATTPVGPFNPGQNIGVPGWTTTSAYSVLVTPSNRGSWLWQNPQPTLPSLDGGNFVAADGSFGLGTLTQMLHNLVPNTFYNLTFYQAAGQLLGTDGPTTEQWRVTIGGSLSQTTSVTLPDGTNGGSAQIVANALDEFTTPLMSINSHGFSGWTPVSFTFRAQFADELLGFLALGTPLVLPPMVLLDGVAITAVPQPASYMLLGVGLLGVLLARRQQKKRA